MLAAVAVAAAAAAAPNPRRFLRVDARRRTANVTLIAGYDGTNGGFNFDGYSRTLMFTVPKGWRVGVTCTNRGPLRHSCAVVQGAGSSRLAFRGASTPTPFGGLAGGQTASFAFRATRIGVFRFVCLVPGHEEAQMWDVLQVVARGRPSVTDLAAR